MTQTRLTTIDSLAELRQQADAWDNLWQRSTVALPFVRAELIAQWVEQFVPTRQFHAIAVEQEGRLLAALPLVPTRLAGVVEASGLPQNHWVPCGDLLLDEQADVDAVLDQLTEGLADVRHRLVWLSGVRTDTSRWQRLMEAIGRQRLSYEHGHLCDIGWIDIDHDWQAYQNHWPKNHRRNLGKALRRLDREGGVELVLHSRLSEDEVEPLLCRGFAIEDRSWKGEAGSSVLRSDAILPYFVQQARQLAAWGQLEIAMLVHNGEEIAFEYSATAKGVYHSLKVGYDERFASYSPGQVLMYLLLERFFADPARKAIDCLGPLSDAVARWQPNTYTEGRLVIAPRRLLSQLLLHAYTHWWPRWKQLRGKAS